MCGRIVAVFCLPKSCLGLDEMSDEINGQGKYDGRVLFSTDACQRLQVAQLEENIIEASKL